MSIDITTLDETELITLEALVTNERMWALLLKMSRRQIETLWVALRETPIADESQVLANHKLAVGVEAVLIAMFHEMEGVVKHRQFKATEPPYIPDQTEALYS